MLEEVDAVELDVVTFAEELEVEVVEAIPEDTDDVLDEVAAEALVFASDSC